MYTYVADTDALGFASLGKFLHLLPGLDVVPVTDDVSGAILMSRELVVVALRVEKDRPVLKRVEVSTNGS